MRSYFPYETLAEDPSVILSNARLDSVRPEPYPVEDHLYSVEFGRVSEPSEWSIAALDAEVEVPGVDHFGHQDLEVLLVAMCPSTNLRRAVPLTADSSGRFVGTIELARALCQGRVDVHAEVGATIDGAPNRRIGESHRWQVRFDTAQPLAIHGALDVQWVHFVPSEDGVSPVPPEARDETFFVDLTGTEPVVYLNLDIEGYHLLLEEGGNRPPLEEQLRTTELRRIATATWSALFNVAISGIRRDDDASEPDWPSEEWQVRVLRMLLPRAYPGAEPEEALAQARTDLEDGDANLQARIQVAVSSSLKSRKALEDGLKTVDSESE